ncbi:MAG: ribosome maturation factor RimP, partial [Pseudomonadota bacterium]
LFRLDQFRRFENHPARIEARQSIESRKKWKGIIASVTDDTVHLQVAEETIAIPFSNILKARLVLE